MYEYEYLFHKHQKRFNLQIRDHLHPPKINLASNRAKKYTSKNFFCPFFIFNFKFDSKFMKKFYSTRKAVQAAICRFLQSRFITAWPTNFEKEHLLQVTLANHDFNIRNLYNQPHLYAKANTKQLASCILNPCSIIMHLFP